MTRVRQLCRGHQTDGLVDALRRPISARERTTCVILLVTALAYGLVALAGVRTDASKWIDLPILALLVGWLVLSLREQRRLAAVWMGWGGAIVVLVTALFSGGVSSPAWVGLFVLLSYAERFLHRRDAVGIVALTCGGGLTLGLVQHLGLLGDPLYVHSTLERSLLLVGSLLLSGLVLVGRWDERSRTLADLMRSTDRLQTVNVALDAARTDAVARARQQQLLARLTVHAFAQAGESAGRSSSELDALLSRCCAVAQAELGGGRVVVRSLGAHGRVWAECGRPSRTAARHRRWPIVVHGDHWGDLEQDVPHHPNATGATSTNERLFVDGVVALVAAAVERHQTLHALQAKENQLREAKRYEGLAFRASGVVHDLNNALGCILQNTELALEDVEQGEPIEEGLVDILQSARSATSMARQLLDTTAPPDEQASSRVELAAVVDEELRALAVSMGSSIEVECHTQGVDSWVPMTPGAAHQVLMNLVVNACQAMPNGGRLRVSLQSSDHTGEVELRVSDTGGGIPLPLQQRIFEPMFTTKRGRGGTGLGLATVRSIVEESRGRISVQSTEGVGSTFCVVLPKLRVQPSGEVDAAVPASPPLPRVSAQSVPVEAVEWETGTSQADGQDSTARVYTVLSVDACPRVRQAMDRSLRRAGFRVLAAEDPEDAIALSRSHGGEVDLLLTDYFMPQMDGLELGRRMRAEGVEVPVVMVTSRPDEARRDGADATVAAIVAKPVRHGELIRRIEDTLMRRSKGARQTDTRWTG